MLNAVLRAKPGKAEAMRGALEEMSRHVRSHEPGTIGFYVGQSESEPLVFVTYERFRDRAAMDAHNTSSYRDAWIARFGELFDGDLVIHIGAEVAAK